ncbi:MAG: hypothetical protein ACUVQV_05565 [Dissulfurimicrobium sp.]|uniref:hypothetical protein n=1 Tax=Dissulfurimicrobium sp. TaxID=2022436 RepID=UPI004049404A
MHEAERLTPVLTPWLIKALVDLGLQIERLQGGPQDIEWPLIRPASYLYCSPDH